MKRLCVVLAAVLGACGGAAQDDAAPPAAPPAAVSDAFVAQARTLAGRANDDGEPLSIDSAAAVTAPDNTEAPALDK
jgi:hypothetical protein